MLVTRYNNAGFTLIEVMIALSIVAVAMAAILSTVSSSVNNSVGLQERTFAHWVAMNKIAEVHIENDKSWPALRKTTGKMEMGHHEWHWTMEVKKPAEDDGTMRWVHVYVRNHEDDESPLAALSALVGKPDAGKR